MNCRRTRLHCLTLLLTLSVAVAAADESNTLKLNLRFRVETAEDSGNFHTLTKQAHWNSKETAVVICDMWDKHWCRGATRRVGEMAPRMNEVVRALRNKGALIIHAPSSTMDHYKNTPQRKLALQAPKVETKIPLQGWCHLDKAREGDLPIDDSNGGCDCEPRCKGYAAWSSQIAAIEIGEGDAITDDAHAYYLMRQRGIKNVIVMGVHTNMCVLGRPFSIRQMIYQGQNVALVRDLTDTMYDPRSKPFVSHFTGTDYVVEHIERHWGPTLTSADLIGGKELRFRNDKRPHLAIVMAEQEYQTGQTLPVFARHHLGKDFRVSYVFAGTKDRNNLPGIDVLDQADIALFSVRRRTPPKKQLDAIRRFVAAGKPVVGIRTSSHAFALRGGQQPPKGHDHWPQFDAQVFGGNYHLHHGNNKPGDPPTMVWPQSGAESHPILAGVPEGEFRVVSWLYKTEPLGPKTKLLLMGRVGNRKPHEPVAWTNTHVGGGRAFYTSLGHPKDFAEERFQKLLLNGIHWAAGKIAKK